MKKIITVLLVVLISIFSTACNITINANTNTEEKDKKEEKVEINTKNLTGKVFTRTYNIRHVDESNDYNYVYITIREFQAEEIETVKVERSMFSNVKEGENYEITFEIVDNSIKDNIKSIFNCTKINKANKTDKTGLEQINENFE